MTSTVRGPVWSMDLAEGWTTRATEAAPFWAGPHEVPCVAIVPPTSDAALRLITWYDDRAGSAEAAARAPADHMLRHGALVTPVACGDFRGYQATDAAYGDHWRQWWLFAGRVPLAVVYRSDPSVAGRDDAALELMLRTLGSRPGAYRLRRTAAGLAGGWSVLAKQLRGGSRL